MLSDEPAGHPKTGEDGRGSHMQAANALGGVLDSVDWGKVATGFSSLNALGAVLDSVDWGKVATGFSSLNALGAVLDSVDWGKVATGFSSLNALGAVLDSVDWGKVATGFSSLNALGAAWTVTRAHGAVPGYQDATRALLKSIGVDGDAVINEIEFTPSDDDRAYETISEAAPDLAVAVDAAASMVRTPFWSRRAVRNSLAWSLVSLVIAMYVAGAMLPPPWGAVVSVVLGLAGVSAPDAYRLLSLPKAHERNPEPSLRLESQDSNAPRT